jgi:hypothetical protein
LARTEVENLRKGATVQLDDSFFGPPTPAAGAPGAAPAPLPAAKN